ncbi:MAG: helix-turn-helix domain-containing protein [Bacteroidales bacterium]|jgi:transposase|nr:helix-turn-helix domain-containing protein [Bacteroidales bacterium]
MSNNLKQKALELKQQGLSYQQIADELGVGKTTVYNWIVYANDNNENDPVSDLPDEKESILELKKEIAELRNKITQGINTKSDMSDEVELRKLELEHEFRMEELENNRREELLKREIAELEQQNEQVQKGSERSLQLVEGLTELNEQFKSNLSDLHERLSGLEEEVSVLENPPVPNSELEVHSLKKSFVKRLSILLIDYLELDGEDCTLELIESINEKLVELKSEVEEWAESNDFDLDDEDVMDILENFIEDVKDALLSLEDIDEDDRVLEIDDDWKQEMEDWLESV